MVKRNVLFQGVSDAVLQVTSVAGEVAMSTELDSLV